MHGLPGTGEGSGKQSNPIRDGQGGSEVLGVGLTNGHLILNEGGLGVILMIKIEITE